MALNLKDFHAEIRNSGVHHNNRYRVTIDLPNKLQAGGSILGELLGNTLETAKTRQLTLRCSSAVFPGIHMMTKDDIFRYGYGPIDKTASGVMFSDIGCNFILDDRGDVYDFFTKWQRLAVRADSSGGMNKFSEDELDRIIENEAKQLRERQNADLPEISVFANKQTWQPYEVGYKDSYTGGLSISMLNVRNKSILRCNANKVFPVQVGDIQIGYDQNDQVSILPVTFSYRDHRTKRINQLNVSSVLGLF